ncbi:hypothetical protein Poli38472_002789 [Pythium oligandrum]|uniref:Glycoside hydrolase family 5 domain-containing protein n=1 Tax=Pythium oligandrum TaxID=41045 RepID=A0A8K1CK35_PYTOL|nr:hypothetical protein Poli38472_002789 [Pythium oligandrum]|eukprot:TMW63848.1 hypothetical protein Poli38472_002789 [Pythium oligandrum]
MDGEVGNPTEYPDMGCALPNYVSRNGKIYVIGPQGRTEALTIKGVNWFGMETSATLPLGLWSNPQTGTTAYAIAAFLARNNFNSVRLPICVESLVKNIAPNKDIVNQYENRAIQLNTHLNPLKGIIKALGHRQISVMISLHTLNHV